MRRLRLHPAHLFGWPIVLLLLFGPGRRPAADEGERDPSRLRRLLGPVADAAADVQWIRFQQARIAGRHDLALARAESALALDPGDPTDWELLAGHYGLFLASPQREPDPQRRLHWFRAGLAVLERGMEQTAETAHLFRLRAAFFITKVDDDPDLPWPGGTEAMWAEAVRATEEADRREVQRSD